MTEKTTEDRILTLRINGSSTLQALLGAYQVTLLQRHYKASDKVKSAIYAFRDSELDMILDWVRDEDRELTK